MKRTHTAALLAAFYALSAPLYLYDAWSHDDPRGRVLYPLCMAALAATAAPGLWKMTRWGWIAALAHEFVRLMNLFRDAVERVVHGEWPQYTPEALREAASKTNLPIDMDAAVWLPMLVVVSGATFVLTWLSIEWRSFFPVQATLVEPPPPPR